MTKSEEMFERFCSTNNIRADRIQTGQKRMPDYLLRCGDVSIVVEVKQFDAGPTEQITLRKTFDELNESDAFYQGVPGDRVN
jgi:hypothetical protein